MSTTVLIVDDDDLHRPFLGRIVAASPAVRGYKTEIVTAKDGEEALKIVRSTKPDVVICDLLMPHMDGFRFCEILRASSEGQSAGLVVISGMYRDAAVQRRVAEQFGAAFFAKPSQLKAMVHEVERLLAERAPEPMTAPQEPVAAPDPVVEPARAPQTAGQRARESRRVLLRRTPPPKRSQPPTPRGQSADGFKYRGKRLVTKVRQGQDGVFRAVVDVEPSFPDGASRFEGEDATAQGALGAAKQSAKDAIDRHHEQNSRRIPITNK